MVVGSVSHPWGTGLCWERSENVYVVVFRVYIYIKWVSVAGLCVHRGQMNEMGREKSSFANFFSLQYSLSVFFTPSSNFSQVVSISLLTQLYVLLLSSLKS